MERMIITVARQYGSGGKAVGEKLARRLGIDFYGKEELMALAKERPDYEEVRSFYEEQPVNSLLYAIAMKEAVGDAGEIPFRRIRELCGDRSCVLVGRCGNYIFKAQENCVRIFIYASMDKKIQWIQNMMDLPARKAEKVIKETENERAQFHKYYTGEEWGCVNHYDLCIDAGILGTEKTVDVILDYLKSRGLIDHD